MRTHLFVAPAPVAFGEVILGMRLARELHERGDAIVFLAPSQHTVLLAATPFRHLHADRIEGAIDRQIPAAIEQCGASDVVLLDLMITLMTIGLRQLDIGFLDRLPVPVYALDIWDLGRGTLRLDLLGLALTFPPAARTIVARRLQPVPFARPDAPGAYCALPPPPVLGPEDRARTRAALGVEADERVVIMTSSNFQLSALNPEHFAKVGPALLRLAQECQRAGDRVRVLHFGPDPLVGAGDRYRHHPQVAAPEFERLVHGADLLITANQSATSLTTALTLGVPALAAISSSKPYIYRVFPLGFSSFMDPLLQGNGYAEAVPTVEIFGEGSVMEGVRRLLYDEDARAAQLARNTAYLAEVRRLPSGAARFEALG